MENITKYLIKSTVKKSEVKAWEETVMLPTYEIGKEEKNPVFIEKRVYQGSSGVVYPYPVVEKICDEKKEKAYRAVFLENEYLKIMILPELGGRVQMAYDKIKQRHFVYYNQVIKPALVGLTGPWISGGIEFNWPQHHRPSTYLPTECTIEEFPDGSVTVWCSEVERMFRTKGMAGFTLYPGKAYLEIKAKVYNRTSLPQTFLWWANPAVVVHKDYYSVFPPDVNAVFDHGKRAVSSFPIATGVYYKQDYSSGVDISKYKNIPVPTSYMAINSKYDFVGGYEENVEAGLLHVADHHVNAGKKQWTWGCGDFGQAWDRNLTDEDGPYIELMTGMYCDNQPDFTWLQPYEEKEWKQYFMPYSAVGMVKNATKEAIVTLKKNEDKGEVILYTTSVYKSVRILVTCGGKVYLDSIHDMSPAEPVKESFALNGVEFDSLKLCVYDNNGKVLVEYEAEKKEIKPIPDPAKAAKDPKDIASIEQLYLTGLHLEQYRHATYNPTDYYMEALSREPGDVRCNNAMGLFLMRRGQFAKAQPYFEAAIATLIERNPNPIDGEPHYNLGWSLKMQGKFDEAYDAFFKATWSAAQQDSAYYALAQIDCIRNDFEKALEHIDRSLVRNWHNHKARQLKASILRKLGKKEAAATLIAESLSIDKFNIGCRFELYLLGGESAQQALDEMMALMNETTSVHSYIEYALDFANAGLYAEAERLLLLWVNKNDGIVYPMVYYALGYFALGYYNKRNRKEDALACLEKAFALDTNDDRILMELDQLYKKLRRPHKERLAFLEKHLDLVERRDDLSVERVTLYNQLGEYEKAKSLIASRKFHPWEGGEGKISGQYIICRIELAKKAIAEKRYQDAIDLLRETEYYPFNLGEGKLAGAEENDIHYFMGCAYEGLGDKENAELYFRKATVGSAEPAIAFFYNDQQPDKICYQGLAWRKLGDEKKARSRFNKLINHGEQHLFDHVKIDYFAVSLPDLLIWEDDLNLRNQIHCNLVMGLGYLGLNDRKTAERFLGKVRELDINHQGLNVL